MSGLKNLLGIAVLSYGIYFGFSELYDSGNSFSSNVRKNNSGLMAEINEQEEVEEAYVSKLKNKELDTKIDYSNFSLVLSPRFSEIIFKPSNVVENAIPRIYPNHVLIEDRTGIDL
jgi:hypothetical protein